MSFVQTQFLWFFLAVLVVYWSLPHRAQNVFLVLASLLFAGWVHPWFLIVLVGAATVDWIAALGMEAYPERKKEFLALTIGVAALNFAIFKYLDFGIENVAAVLHLLGFESDLHPLRLLMPAGLSFWTFQTLSYVVDVYRGTIHARKSWLDYMLFVLFFPQLVVGPIERAGRLLTQVEQPRTLNPAAFRSGLALALFGLCKKVVIADTIAPYVNAIYAGEPSAYAAWAACAAFMVQLLADFSGYSDMAVGLARMLGFELVNNFNHPYLSRSPIELWSRWHISMSSWLRDYIYHPLANARWVRRWVRIPGVPESGLFHQGRVTMLTFLFSGLWHGAAWHYIAWGLYWGAVHTAWLVARRKVPRSWLRYEKSVALIGVMWIIELGALQLFREPSLARAAGYFVGQPPLIEPAEQALAHAALSLGAAGASLLVAAMVFEMFVLPRAHGPARLFLESAGLSAAVIVVLVFAQPLRSDFLYFVF